MRARSRLAQCATMRGHVLLILLLGETLCQPLSPADDIPPAECCPCPVGAARAPPLTAECPCLGEDAEGAASGLLARAVQPQWSDLRPTEPKEDAKPLLHPEVDLASSVLQTLREATDEEYQEAVARDAARSAARAVEETADSADTAKNIVTIIVNSKPEDDIVQEASHVQETRCIHPVGSRHSLGQVRSDLSKSQPLFRESFSIPKVKPKGLLHRVADMDSGASNVQEHVVGVNRGLEGLKLRANPSILDIFPIKREKNVNRPNLRSKTNLLAKSSDDESLNGDVSSTKVPDLRLKLQARPKPTNLASSRSGDIHKFVIPKLRLNHVKRPTKDDLDSSPSPSNIREQITEPKSTDVSKFSLSSLMGSSNLKNRPLSLNNLLNLKDVELIPSKPIKVRPGLKLIPTLRKQNDLSKTTVLKNTGSIGKDGCDDKAKELNTESNIQIPREKTEVDDAVPSPSDNHPLVAERDNTDILDAVPSATNNHQEVIESGTESNNEQLADVDSTITGVAQDAEGPLVKENSQERVDFFDPNEESFIPENGNSDTIIVINNEQENQFDNSDFENNAEFVIAEGLDNQDDYQDSEIEIVSKDNDNNFDSLFDSETGASNFEFQVVPQDYDDLFRTDESIPVGDDNSKSNTRLTDDSQTFKQDTLRKLEGSEAKININSARDSQELLEDGTGRSSESLDLTDDNVDTDIQKVDPIAATESPEILMKQNSAETTGDENPINMEDLQNYSDSLLHLSDAKSQVNPIECEIGKHDESVEEESLQSHEVDEDTPQNESTRSESDVLAQNTDLEESASSPNANVVDSVSSPTASFEEPSHFNDDVLVDDVSPSELTPDNTDVPVEDTDLTELASSPNVDEMEAVLTPAVSSDETLDINNEHVVDDVSQNESTPSNTDISAENSDLETAVSSSNEMDTVSNPKASSEESIGINEDDLAIDESQNESTPINTDLSVKNTDLEEAASTPIENETVSNPTESSKEASDSKEEDLIDDVSPSNESTPDISDLVGNADLDEDASSPNETKTILNPPTTSQESSDINEGASPTNVEEQEINNAMTLNRDDDGAESKACLTDMASKTASIENVEKQAQSDNEPAEMTAEASAPVSAIVPHTSSRASGSSLLHDIVVQPSSLFDGNGYRPLPGIGNLLNFNAQLPTVDDIRSGIADIFGTSGRAADGDKVNSEFELGDSSEAHPMMANEASTNRAKAVRPSLNPLENVNLDIFQVNPLSQVKIPRLNMNSFKTKLAIPKSLDLKPVKLQSSLGKEGNLLGATLTFGPERLGSSRQQSFNSRGPNISGNRLSAIPDFNDFRNTMRANAENLLSSSPLSRMRANTLPSGPSISTLSDNLRAHTENTMRNIQQSLATSKNEAKMKNVGALGNKYAKPQHVFEDVNDKLRAIHLDMTDRLSSMHDSIVGQAKLPILRSSAAKPTGTFKVRPQSKSSTLGRTSQPISSTNLRARPTSSNTGRLSSPRSKTVNADQKFKPFKISSAASTLTPKTVEVPKLTATSMKPPFARPLQRDSSLKLKENKPITEIIRSQNARPALKSKFKPFGEKKIKVSISTTERPKATAFKPRPVVTQTKPVLGARPTLPSNGKIQSAQRTSGNRLQEHRRANGDSRGFASELNPSRAVAPKATGTKKAEIESRDFGNARLAQFRQSPATKPKSPLLKQKGGATSTQTGSLKPKPPTISDGTILSVNNGPSARDFEQESLLWPKGSMQSNGKTSQFRQSPVNKPTKQSNGASSLQATARSQKPKALPISGKVLSENEPSPTEDESETSLWPKVTLSWPKASDTAFINKVREALKARFSTLSPKPAKPVNVATSRPKAEDMLRSASEHNDVVVADDAPLKENVSYRCRMVCVREPIE